MQDLENLYEKCRLCIHSKIHDMTSSDALALYTFAEQHAINGKVPQEVIDAARKVVDKYQEYSGQL